MAVSSPLRGNDLMPTASSMTFTEITRAADQIRGRWNFNWLQSAPEWDWPARRKLAAPRHPGAAGDSSKVTSTNQTKGAAA